MSLNKLGVYIHIPYCLQRCSYCDFATYVHTELPPPEYYTSLVKKEIFHKQSLFSNRPLDTIYFGGGTPSLIAASNIVDLINELAKFGYTTGPNTEITIEINPATVDERKLETYLAAGVNRFSVGAQTFSDRLLKMVNREHNAKQTLQTLELLKKYNLNFSFDVLFALPTQTLDELKYDVSVAVDLGSKHISPYCLTVPEGHPLSKNRPLDDEQIEMFDIIDNQLTQKSFNRYEISNYALASYESKHNLLYWTDDEYWGLGLSAHSYIKTSKFGTRFFNQNNFNVYDNYIKQLDYIKTDSDISPDLKETLEKHQSLTDFCYTSLRLSTGLSVEKLVQKYDSQTLGLVEKRAESAVAKGFLELKNGHYLLTKQGIMISNQIFENFVFLSEDLV